MSCEIFNKTLILDADLSSASIDGTSLNAIKTLIGAYDSSLSGIWRPIIIKQADSTAEYCEPLIMAGGGLRPSFAPCNCTDGSLDIVTADALNTFQDSNLDCNYCGTPTAPAWSLQDQQGNTYGSFNLQTCCSGACDIRMKRDDYIPKIPVLDQTQISGFLDWKYLGQFPACTNPGLGFEKFITLTGLSSISGAELCIDWKLKDTIGEIPYDKISSQYNDEYSHNKALIKSKLKSQTCGNFILTHLNSSHEATYTGLFPLFSGLIGSQNQNKNTFLPPIDQFNITPYGFDKQTYNNIFIHNDKIASYWKWNYTSGVLGWYRYYDTSRTNDTRPIPGIDLYISPGDVFFTTNDGPEPEPVTTASNSFIKTCPSGLKVIKNNGVACVIPSGSNFLYISANIYDLFYEFYNTLLPKNDYNTNTTLSQAALLATAPQYDQVTVDLQKDNIFYSYSRNDLGQIETLNKDMSVTTTYDSVSDLNFISTTGELVSTLANKYGAYLWIPPQSTKTINFNIPIQSDSFYIDMNFDMNISQTDTRLRSSCNPVRSCGTKSYTKSFFYDQTISLGSTSLSTNCFDSVRHIESCSNGQTLKGNFTNYCSLMLNSSRIKSVSAGPTCATFQDT